MYLSFMMNTEKRLTYALNSNDKHCSFSGIQEDRHHLVTSNFHVDVYLITRFFLAVAGVCWGAICYAEDKLGSLQEGSFCCVWEVSTVTSGKQQDTSNSGQHITGYYEVDYPFWSTCRIPGQFWPLLFSCSGIVWRTKQITIHAIHIQMWPGILQFSLPFEWQYPTCRASCWLWLF